eukprot:5236597-Prorocentrum_lima.AAC.1
MLLSWSNTIWRRLGPVPVRLEHLMLDDVVVRVVIREAASGMLWIRHGSRLSLIHISEPTRLDVI